MDEKDFNKLQNDLDVANMFIRAAEEVGQLNAEREKRNREKAVMAAERRRREKALDEAYAEYCRKNPPTESEGREELKRFKAYIKGKGNENDKA